MAEIKLVSREVIKKRVTTQREVITTKLRELNKVADLVNSLPIMKRELPGCPIHCDFSLSTFDSHFYIRLTNYPIDFVIGAMLPAFRTKFNTEWRLDASEETIYLHTISMHKRNKKFLKSLKYTKITISVDEQEMATCKIVCVKPAVEAKPVYRGEDEYYQPAVYAVNCTE